MIRCVSGVIIANSTLVAMTKTRDDIKYVRVYSNNEIEVRKGNRRWIFDIRNGKILIKFQKL